MGDTLNESTKENRPNSLQLRRFSFINNFKVYFLMSFL